MIENINVFYNDLPDGHLLKLLHDEHESIKNVMSELEMELDSLDNYSISDDAGSVIEKLKILTANLLNAEPHHQREEDILFEAMEKSGISGPTSAMKTEHYGFRKYKNKLKMQIDNINNGEFKENKLRIRYTAIGLIGFIRGHIEKEENILYPMAFQTLKEPELWRELSRGCTIFCVNDILQVLIYTFFKNNGKVIHCCFPSSNCHRPLLTDIS